MQELLRALFEKLVEKQEKTPRLLYWTFSVTTVLLGFAFIVTNPVFGWFVVGGPLLVALLTRMLGLTRVPLALLVVAGLLALVPAFFLGMFDREGGWPSGPALVGLVAFVVWVTAYPVLLDVLNKRHHRARQAVAGAGREPEPDAYEDEHAEYLLLMITLWTSAVVMYVSGSTIVGTVCALALCYRRRGTALIAGLACLLAPFLAFSYGAISVDFNPLVALATMIGAPPWWQAVKREDWGEVRLFRRRQWV